MECKRCGNKDLKYFYLGSKGYYCRKCIAYKRFLIDEPLPKYLPYQSQADNDYYLDFKLTLKQEETIFKIQEIIKESNLVVYAACGAGKTEMMYPIIKDYLNNNLRVGFAIARRQVVIELAERFQRAFKNIKVTKVCQGFTNDIYGDLIICTTHQLYRYYNYFDLLIIDEPDAFPFKNDEILQAIAVSSCKERIIYLTATPEGKLLKLPQVTLFKRPHEKPLPLPSVSIGPVWLLYIQLMFFIKNCQKGLIFVPTIEKATLLSKLLFLSCLHSKIVNKEEVLDNFIQDKKGFLICTTILERGVTIKNIDVCVLFADHGVFDLASLIQIAGRVGRDVSHPGGKVLFLSLKKTKKVEECLKQINLMNA